LKRKGACILLKGIPQILSPELLKILMEMGHGDEIILGDGNFPAASNAQRLVRCDGHGVPELLDAILKLFPLDTFVEKPVSLMGVVPGDKYVPEIWKTYSEIIEKYDGRAKNFEFIERFEFYERTKKAYAVIATGESARYANIILKKGIIGD
jgi:L-fucose mutarotase